ncbi:MAG TPA: hypothetical protein VL133_16850 [Devosia sp.]|nr:hypothetical protein [Devosia sp.]HTN64072.1 hypothetical protein [Devosia sp.]
MPLIATCHCGSTKIELPGLPSSAKECNCSYCHRTGAIWGYYSPDEVKIVAADHDAIYSASRQLNQHHFCAKCGGNTHGSSPDWASMYNNDGTLKPGMAEGVPSQRVFGVNLRMIDDIDLGSIEITEVDGRNSW